MKVFASDLDQTLIYSRRWLTDAKNTIQCVEKSNGEPTSYSMGQAMDILTRLSEKHTFVPVTTRTKQQFERIKFPFQIPLAIVANGGIILRDGQIDEQWSAIVSKANQESASIDDMKEILFEPTLFNGVLKRRIADDLFIYFVINPTQFDRAQLGKISKRIENMGWCIYPQHKKVYFMPQNLTKGRALAYLKKMEGFSYIVSAGDSNLDEAMREVSDCFLSPKHSHLNSDLDCAGEGLQSGLEITQQALKCLNKQ